MKIVLIRPKYESHILVPPLGLGYLASYLQQRGVEVVLLDALARGLNNMSVLEAVHAEAPDAVGITCLTASYPQVVKLTRLLKRSGFRVVLGGVHPTFCTWETLADTGADWVVRGEGERAMLELIQRGFNHQGIAGVYGVHDESPRAPLRLAAPVEDLDDLPFPDWSQMHPLKYSCAPHGVVTRAVPIGTIITSRGCPYSCSFCASPRFWNRRVRFRSPANVVEEIVHLYTRFGVREIHFEDDNLTLKRDHIEEICHRLIAAGEGGVKIHWGCPNGIRADAIDERLLQLMKRSGGYSVAYGIETADAAILARANKCETIETLSNAITCTAKAGIETLGFFIFGLPGETLESIDRTIEFAAESDLTRAQFTLLDVLPGSALWDQLQGQFEPNWAKVSFAAPEWVPSGLTAGDLLAAQSRAFRAFYLRKPWRFMKTAVAIRPRQWLYLYRRAIAFRFLR